MGTISSTVTHGVTLGQGTYTSPLTITLAGYVDDTGDSGNAITGPNNQGWTVINNSRVRSTGSHGILLMDGGSVSNIGTISGADSGARFTSAAGTVSNTGTIIGTLQIGIYAGGGGNITNTGAGALIEGGYEGIYAFNGGGTITNNGGTIIGTTAAGIGVLQNARIDNLGPAALIEGAAGIIVGKTSLSVSFGAGTVNNTGKIIATNGVGVELTSGGYIGNTDSAALIQGILGIDIIGGGTVSNAGTIIGTLAQGILFDTTGAGTVIDSGTISGGGGTAVAFNGTAGGNLLVLEHGYSLGGGTVTVAGTGNTLELLGTAGAVAVGLNTHNLTNFGTVTFGAASGNNEVLQITNTASLPGTISGFTQAQDIVDLTQFASPASAVVNFNSVTNQLTVTEGSQSVTLQLDAESYTGIVWQAGTDSGTGTAITACFCRGTMILTPDGEVAVEELAIGDPIVTWWGETRAIRWIGRRAYDGRFIAGNREALPICVKKGALADGVPARDLWVSPGHSLYIGGALARSEHLINGATIVQADRVDAVEYFHIELDSHDVIFADGAPAETFVDCDNRARFANGAEYAALYPDDDRPGWTFCAPCLQWGMPELNEIRAALLQRAIQRGNALDPDPDLHVHTDGKVTSVERISPLCYRIRVPAGAADVRLISRVSVPAAINASTLDLRVLGVAVAKMVLSDASLCIEIAHGHPALCDGFHDDEETLRWTDGNARVPAALLRPFAEGCTIDIHLVATDLQYWRPTAANAA